MVSIQDYCLADDILIRYVKEYKDSGYDGSNNRLMVFQPAIKAVVLGQSNSLYDSVNIEQLVQDGIPMMHRPSGGETVVITPNMLIISFCMASKVLPKSHDTFRVALSAITNALKENGIVGVLHQGISDLTINGRKILGCAIYRRTGVLLYHAVLNVSESPLLIAKYLKHPAREPDYREKRSHEQFITSIHDEGYRCGIGQLKLSLQNHLLHIIE